MPTLKEILEIMAKSPHDSTAVNTCLKIILDEDRPERTRKLALKKICEKFHNWLHVEDMDIEDLPTLLNTPVEIYTN